MDNEKGLVNLPWEKIKKVEFLNTTINSLQVFGDPVSGTVQTTQGAFTGLIEWDQDERLTTDILDGDFEEEGMKIPFSEILTIYKKGEGSHVILATGEDYYLTGSNDVNGENRGIVIPVNEQGRIVVPWEEFVKVTFNTNNEYKGLAYNDFPIPQTLKGTVFAKNGQTYAGLLLFDIDESFDIEFLQGKIRNIEYQIPFRNIVSISPIDDASSTVLLSNGEKLILCCMQDVTSANDGIMIYENNSSYTIISWDELVEVRFK
jgi:hypothetical protein